MELRIWEYIDGLCEPRERSAIERLIAENAAWRARYHELLEVHQLIGQTELEQPSLRFTKNVMEEIAKCQIAPAAKSYINNKIVYGIAIFFLTLIVGFVVYGISQIDWGSAKDSAGMGGLDFSKVDYSRIFNNSFVNIFMMLNIVLGLMLLDRYLNNKRKHYMKEA